MPLVEDVDDRHHVHACALGTGCVHVVRECYEPDVVHREYVVRILTDLNIVSSESAQIFADDEIDLAGLCVIQKALHARSVKADAGNTVINILIIDCPPLLRDIFRQDCPLVFDGE